MAAGLSSQTLTRCKSASIRIQLECAPNSPIIFVAHSLGGIVVKRVSSTSSPSLIDWIFEAEMHLGQCLDALLASINIHASVWETNTP
jgi:hypothetical protein